MFEVPVAYKLGAVVGSGVMIVLAQIADLIPAEPGPLIGQSVFVTATIYASRLIMKAVKEAQTEVVASKDARIEALKEENEYLREELDRYRSGGDKEES